WLRRRELGHDDPRQTFRLTFPRTVTAEQVVAALRSIQGLLPPWPRRLLELPCVVLEASGTSDGVTHRLIVERGRARYVIGQLKASVPGLRAEPETERDVVRPDLARE